jgi:trehalose synthase
MIYEEVIGGNVGGVLRQIRNGVNGFLVPSVEETAARIVQRLRDRRLRDSLRTDLSGSIRLPEATGDRGNEWLA